MTDKLLKSGNIEKVTFKIQRKIKDIYSISYQIGGVYYYWIKIKNVTGRNRTNALSFSGHRKWKWTEIKKNNMGKSTVR